MSDRPTAVNGKRNQAWGTTNACPQCGECLCFACHPAGPCVDEHVRPALRSRSRWPLAAGRQPPAVLRQSTLNIDLPSVPARSLG